MNFNKEENQEFWKLLSSTGLPIRWLLKNKKMSTVREKICIWEILNGAGELLSLISLDNVIHRLWSIIVNGKDVLKVYFSFFLLSKKLKSLTIDKRPAKSSVLLILWPCSLSFALGNTFGSKKTLSSITPRNHRTVSKTLDLIINKATE